jgi:4-hydroxy-4-methyl-2-oxoglutarate aldolase
MTTATSSLEVAELLAGLSAAHVADACVSLSIPFRLAPPSIRPLFTPIRLTGWALPVSHRGSVDVFFDAMTTASPGDVFVIDNEGRVDEGCVGDLVIAEAAAYGMAGAVIWGTHRDSHDLKEIRLPVFSTGSCPAGPRGVRDGASETCMIGEVEVTRADVVIGDDDGLLFIEGSAVPSLLDAARWVARSEQNHRRMLTAGTTLHQQFEWDQYVWMRRTDPSYTFRQHLARLNKAIEK